MKTILTILIILITLLSILTSALLYSNWKMSQTFKNNQLNIETKNTREQTIIDSQNPDNKTQTSQNLFFSDPKEIPSVLQGTIDSVDQDKLILKQNASVDIKYQINKADISSITEQKNNPAFNKEKADQLGKEIQDYLTKNSSTTSPQMNISPNSPPVKPNLPQDFQDRMKEQDVQYLVEEKVDWNALKSGMTVNYQTDEKGNKTLRVFSADSIIAPK